MLAAENERMLVLALDIGSCSNRNVKGLVRVRRWALIQVYEMYSLLDNVHEAQMIRAFLPERRFSEAAISFEIWLSLSV